MWDKVFVFFVIGMFVGWVYAHYHIAAECERLGAFFVGKKVYKIGSITNVEEKDK